MSDQSNVDDLDFSKMNHVFFESRGQRYAVLQNGPTDDSFALVWMPREGEDKLIVTGCRHRLAETLAALEGGKFDKNNLDAEVQLTAEVSL